MTRSGFRAPEGLAPGRLIAVVGPSGVGKHSVLRGLAATPGGPERVRRVITRPPDDPSEDIDAVDEVDFARRIASGAFVLHWQAHGLSYGVPATLCEDLAAGRDMAVNLSRRILCQAARLFPAMVIQRVSAPADVLAARLRGRDREDAAAIAMRLTRAAAAVPPGVPVLDLCNDGPLEVTVACALAALHPPSSG